MYEKLNVEKAEQMNTGIKKTKQNEHGGDEALIPHSVQQGFSLWTPNQSVKKCASGKKSGFNYLLKS